MTLMSHLLPLGGQQMLADGVSVPRKSAEPLKTIVVNETTLLDVLHSPVNDGVLSLHLPKIRDTLTHYYINPLTSAGYSS